MKVQFAGLSAALAGVAALCFASASPSMALTAKECSVKYNAAKYAGTLGELSWNDFRKTQCGDIAAPAVAPAAGTTAIAAIFPKAIDAKYAQEKPGKARMHTCRDQYRVNKAANANGGLKWIMKGGGYYSQCNEALKG
jgi:hypothetical protein